jgi:hypothetical protein
MPSTTTNHRPRRATPSNKRNLSIMLRHPFKVQVSCSNHGGAGGGGSGQSSSASKNTAGGDTSRREPATIKARHVGEAEENDDEMPLLSRVPTISKEWSLSRWIPGSGLMSDPEPC